MNTVPALIKAHESTKTYMYMSIQCLHFLPKEKGLLTLCGYTQHYKSIANATKFTPTLFLRDEDSIKCADLWGMQCNLHCLLPRLSGT